MNVLLWLSLVAPALAGGKAALEARVAALEAENALLQERLAGCEGQVSVYEAGEVDDRKALLADAYTAYKEARWDVAQAKYGELLARWPDSAEAGKARKYAAQVALIGQPAPAITADRWYQGFAPGYAAPVTVLVFFEAWCPHCRTHAPDLKALADRFAGRGMQVVALTRATKDTSDDAVAAFAREAGWTFAVGHDPMDRSTYDAFAVQGVPHVVVVKQGVSVWRGHPAQITDAAVEGWLAP